MHIYCINYLCHKEVLAAQLLMAVFGYAKQNLPVQST